MEHVFDTQGIKVPSDIFDKLFNYLDFNGEDSINITSILRYFRLSMDREYRESTEQFDQSQFGINSKVYYKPILELIKSNLDQTTSQALFDKLDVLSGEEKLVRVGQFQKCLKQVGVAINYWEVFTIFEQINIQKRKLSYQPQRYHKVQLQDLFSTLGRKELWDSHVSKQERDAETQRLLETRRDQQKTRNEDDLLLAESLNQPSFRKMEETKQRPQEDSGIFNLN